MKKPEPKAKLLVERPSMASRSLSIYHADIFISAWIKQECSRFGYFGISYFGRTILNVSPLYDIDEVIEFIESCPFKEANQ